MTQPWCVRLAYIPNTDGLRLLIYVAPCWSLRMRKWELCICGELQEEVVEAVKELFKQLFN